MSDNVPITPGIGTDVATDQVTGTNEHVQLFKLAHSADGSRTLVEVNADGIAVSSDPILEMLRDIRTELRILNLTCRIGFEGRINSIRAVTPVESRSDSAFTDDSNF